MKGKSNRKKKNSWKNLENQNKFNKWHKEKLQNKKFYNNPAKFWIYG